MTRKYCKRWITHYSLVFEVLAQIHQRRKFYRHKHKRKVCPEEMELVHWQWPLTKLPSLGKKDMTKNNQLNANKKSLSNTRLTTAVVKLQKSNNAWMWWHKQALFFAWMGQVLCASCNEQISQVELLTWYDISNQNPHFGTWFQFEMFVGEHNW